MKLKSIYKYLIVQQGKKYLFLFGAVMALVHILFLISLLISDGSISGTEMATSIFMLVLGIVVYRENLSVSLQNGISRKTFFTASILAFITISLIAACGDMLINLLGNTYEKHADMMFDSMYEQMFMRGFNDEDWAVITPAISDYPKIFMFNLTVYISSSALSYAIAAIFYRLNKILKIIIPVGIYIIVMILVPLMALSDNKIINAFIDFMSWSWESVYHISAVLPCIAIIFAAIAFLFIRRVPLNDNKK